MDFEITLSDKKLEEMCRACLAKTSSVSLFVAVFDEGETFNLWEVYEKYTKILVDENDSLPKAVCDECLTDLVTLQKFIQRCISSDVILKTFKQEDTTKIGTSLDDIKKNTESLGSVVNKDVSTDILNKTNTVKPVQNVVLEDDVNDKFDTETAKPIANDCESLNKSSLKFEYEDEIPTCNVENISGELNNSQLDTDENTFESNVESLEIDGHEVDAEFLIKELMGDSKFIIDEEHMLDAEILSAHNIEIKRMSPSAAYDRKRAWEEHNKCKFQCNVCLKPCASQTRLIEHLRTHTKERPFKCDRCEAAFTLICNLTRHIRVHTGEKPYVCKICNKGFTQASSLNSHARLHNDDKPYLCRCGKSFHPDTYCPSSLRRYSARERSKNKMKREDMCKECGTIYTAVCESSNHTSFSNVKHFLCSICGKAYASKMGLEHHYRAHTGERPFKCQVCEKSFKNTTALKMHHLTHTGERPCTCKICGKCFIQPAHLKYHLLIHTGVKAYACTFCSKAFALKGNLTQHLRTHTDESPYECCHCGKAFRTTNSLKKHQKLHEDLNASDNVNIKNEDISDCYIDDSNC